MLLRAIVRDGRRKDVRTRLVGSPLKWLVSSSRHKNLSLSRALYCDYATSGKELCRATRGLSHNFTFSGN